MTKLTGRQASLLLYQNIALSVFHAAFMTATLVAGAGGEPLPTYNTFIGVASKDSILCPLQVKTISSAAAIPDDAIIIPSICKEKCELQLTTTGSKSADFPFRQVAALFSYLSAFFHLGNAYGWRQTYYSYIENARNPFRWAEYSLSASAMYACLAWPLGMVQFPLLVTGTMLIFVTMLFGELAEDANRPSGAEDAWENPSLTQRLKAHLLGWIPQTTAWLMLLYVFQTILETADEDGRGGPPDWVATLALGQMLVFASFGLVQFVLITFARPSQYVYGEYAYNVLSLVSKGILSATLVGYSAFTVFFDELNDILAEAGKNYSDIVCTETTNASSTSWF